MKAMIAMNTMHSIANSITTPSDTPMITKMMNVGVSVGGDVVVVEGALLVVVLDVLAAKYRKIKL